MIHDREQYSEEFLKYFTKKEKLWEELCRYNYDTWHFSNAEPLFPEGEFTHKKYMLQVMRLHNIAVAQGEPFFLKSWKSCKRLPTPPSRRAPKSPKQKSSKTKSKETTSSRRKRRKHGARESATNEKKQSNPPDNSKVHNALMAYYFDECDGLRFANIYIYI